MFRDEGVQHIPNLPPTEALSQMVVVWRMATVARIEHNAPREFWRLLIARQPS